MGNSPQMIFAHYREMVRPADADAFFAIMPPADAVKRADAARENRPRAIPPRMAKITAETMAEVFNGGRLMLTRKQAVTAIMARAVSSAPAAYNALATDGRFAAQLKDSGGNLTWKPNPETENKQLAVAANS